MPVGLSPTGIIFLANFSLLFSASYKNLLIILHTAIVVKNKREIFALPNDANGII